MSDLETGYKWWVRYALVPILVAGVLGGVLLRPKKSDKDSNVIKVPDPATSQDAEKTETAEVFGANPQLVAVDVLYVIDEKNNILTKDVRVRKGSVFTIKWDARDVSSQQLHFLLLEDSGRTIANQKVGQMGMRKVTSDYPVTLKLVEEYGGKLRLIKVLSVQVF